MPKLKEVEVKENSMSWEDIIISQIQRRVITTIPKRELQQFLDKGKKVKKITLEFAD